MLLLWRKTICNAPATIQPACVVPYYATLLDQVMGLHSRGLYEYIQSQALNIKLPENVERLAQAW